LRLHYSEANAFTTKDGALRSFRASRSGMVQVAVVGVVCWLADDSPTTAQNVDYRQGETWLPSGRGCCCGQRTKGHRLPPTTVELSELTRVLKKIAL
jgi:hypothetical protein